MDYSKRRSQVKIYYGRIIDFDVRT